MSPAQIVSYLEIYARLDREQFARDLHVAGMGSRGDPKELQKLVASMLKD